MQRVFTWGGWEGWWGVATTGSGLAGGAWGRERRKRELNWEKLIESEVGLTTMAMALEGPGLQHLREKSSCPRVYLRPQLVPQLQMGMGTSQKEILGVI